MSEKILQEIETYIDSQKDQILADWIELLKIPSVGAPPEGGLPFGTKVDEALEAASQKFSGNGFPMHKKSQSGYALYQDKKEKNIGIFVHADVVPAPEEEWTLTKPFEPLVKNGYLIGRGVRDNKDGIIMALYALKALRAANVCLDSGITVFVGGNEESGMNDIKAYVGQETMPDLSLVPDNTYPYCRGESGLSRVICKSKKPFKGILEFCGGQAFNVIPDDVKVTLPYDAALEAALRTDGCNIYIENGSIVFFEKGISGHACQPENAISAVYLAAKRLAGLKQLDAVDRKILGSVAEWLASPYGEAFGIDGCDAFGPVTVANGFAGLDNGYLYFSLDVRYGTSFEGEDILRKMTDILEKNDFALEPHGCKDGFLLEQHEELGEGILRAVARYGGNAEEKPFVGKFGTYCRYLKNAYSFGTSLYWEPLLVGLEPGCGRAHQVHESASIEGLIQGIKILAAIILEADVVLKIDQI